MAWMVLEENSVPQNASQSQLMPWFSLEDREQGAQLLCAQASDL